jgi:signal transduction histidine kinase
MAEVLEREVMPVVAAQGSWRGEMQGRTRTGDPVEQEVSLTLRPDGGLLCITRDVSERYHAEAERARLAGELEQAQRREMIGQLAAGLAHDFNNLLATISGSASLAAAGLDSGSPAHAHAARILMATEQANGLVRRLLNLGSRKASVQRIDLRDPVREAADLARAGLPRGIVLETDLPDDACPADADPTEIVQIVLNLAINARDAMRQGGGRILVALAAAEPGATEFAVGAMAPDQRCWRIVVADTGPGMTPDVAALVFKPYFSTKGAGGSGLGLASVRSLVASVGGAVRLITEPGEGARFEIFWPLEMRAPDAAPVSGLSRPSQPVLARVQALQGRRILLVDDAEDLLEVLTGFLEAAGALVAATTDPQDALEVLAEDPQSWDLVITDFDMPGLTGADVAHAVKAANPGLPVLLVTALPDWQSRARSADFTGVLGKPVTGRQLVETAARLIAPAEA